MKKTWQDNSNVFGDRPNTITVNVYRVEADDDGNIPKNPDWGEPIDTKELTVDMTSNEKTYELGKDYPQWRYDETTKKVIKYYYQVQEVLPTGSVYEQIQGEPAYVKEISNKEEKKELTLINDSQRKFGKVAVDSSWNTVQQQNTTISMERLQGALCSVGR